MPDPVMPNGSASAGGSPSMKRILWPIGLSFAVLGVIAAFTVEPGMFSRLWAALDVRFMGLAVFLVVVRVAFGGWRLSHVSRGRLNLAGGIRGQLAWDFASNITPSLVGGAPLAAMFVARDTRLTRDNQSSVGEVGAFMLFVMLLDQLWFAMTAPIVLVAALFIEVIPGSLGGVGLVTSAIYLLLFMMWAAVFGYGTLFKPILLTRLFGWVFRLRPLARFRDRALDEMGRYAEQAASIRAQPTWFFVKGFLLTAGTWLARYLLVVAIIASVVPDLDWVLASLRSVAMALGTMLVPTPGGAGGVEGLYVLFYGSLMPKVFVVPTLLVYRLLAYYVFVAIGIALSTLQVQKSTMMRRLMAATVPASQVDDKA